MASSESTAAFVLIAVSLAMLASVLPARGGALAPAEAEAPRRPLSEARVRAELAAQIGLRSEDGSPPRWCGIAAAWARNEAVSNLLRGEGWTARLEVAAGLDGWESPNLHVPSRASRIAGTCVYGQWHGRELLENRARVHVFVAPGRRLVEDAPGSPR